MDDKSYIAKMISGVFKPFLLKMMPELFADFDEFECDFATIHLDTGKIDLGVMSPFELKLQKDWDILAEVENVKVMMISVTREQVNDMVSLLNIERHPTKTIITAKTKFEEIGDVVVEYSNIQIWKEATKQQQEQLKQPKQPKLLN